MKHKILILANSRKMGNRCIAGIDMRTGEWLRPCYKNGQDGIPWQARQIHGKEPQLLDILEIPLSDKGPHLDYQPENRTLLDGSWNKIGCVQSNQILKYCDQSELLLFNPGARIHTDILISLASNHKKSLCLIKAYAHFFTEISFRGKKRVNAAFQFGSHNYCIPVTDYEFENQFPENETSDVNCLMTISLGQPFEVDNFCYKFVAGVILL